GSVPTARGVAGDVVLQRQPGRAHHDHPAPRLVRADPSQHRTRGAVPDPNPGGHHQGARRAGHRGCTRGSPRPWCTRAGDRVRQRTRPGARGWDRAAAYPAGWLRRGRAVWWMWRWQARGHAGWLRDPVCDDPRSGVGHRDDAQHHRDRRAVAPCPPAADRARHARAPANPVATGWQRRELLPGERSLRCGMSTRWWRHQLLPGERGGAEGVTNSESAERLEATFRRWLLGHRDRAAKRLGLTVIGEPQFGVGLRSVSGLCRTSGGEPCWLRVGAELASDVRAFPLVWTGIAESNAVRGVPKPYVLASTDYTDEFNGLQFCVRADAMTVIDGQPISSSRVLRRPVDLPDQWWRDLRSALDTLRATPTDRVKKNPAADARIRKVLGFDLVIPQQE